MSQIKKNEGTLLYYLGGIQYNRGINFFIWPILDP